jgi:hypothetical protein
MKGNADGRMISQSPADQALSGGWRENKLINGRGLISLIEITSLEPNFIEVLLKMSPPSA